MSSMRFTLYHKPLSCAGFTMLELLVAMSMTGICLAIVIGHTLSIHNSYFEDVMRTRINSNLRSSMDIISMNIRQAGENLQSGFPAVVLEDASGGTSDVLRLRRNLIPEVLTLCAAATAGDTALTVSSTTLTDPECVTGNVNLLFNAFESSRSGDEIRLYVYNRISGVGEFVDYTGGEMLLGEYTLSVSALSSDYSALTTNVYFIEEYAFAHNPGEQTLELHINGDIETPHPVAFSVSDFLVGIEMSDMSVQTSLNSSSAYEWKDIRQVQVTLSGQEERKSRTVSSSISAEYFPRNVLSY